MQGWGGSGGKKAFKQMFKTSKFIREVYIPNIKQMITMDEMRKERKKVSFF